MDKAHLRWLHRGTGVGTARVRYRLTGTNDRFWAGQRPSSSAFVTCLADLYFSLLCDPQSIVDFDPEIPDGAFEFGMAEKKLNGPEIPGPPIHQRRFRAAKRMRSVGRRVQSD
jgi:hypothetical protein